MMTGKRVLGLAPLTLFLCPSFVSLPAAVI